jgi:tripartite-type tricarboxylate transporter receptor subunit TctC
LNAANPFLSIKRLVPSPLKAVAAIAASLLVMQTAQAASPEAWPEKPIRMVVPYPAGGSADSSARLLGQKLAEKFGQTVIVENKAGASGNIGTVDVMRAKPDGYTILFNPSAHVIIPSLMEKPPYRAFEDFTPISLVASGPLVLLVTNNLPAKTVREFVDLAKSKPKAVTFATSVIGSASHLAEESLMRSTNTDILVVAYKGNAPALADLIGGHVSAMMDPAVTALQLVRSGKLRALGVTGKDRLASAPEIPTLAESGLPGFEFYTWYGLFAPAGLPQPIADKLGAAVREILQQPDVRSKLLSQGLEPKGTTSAEFVSFMRRETALYEKIIREGNIKPE